MTIRYRDVDVLARTIWGEARGEDREGQLLVAEVILNRWRTEYRGKKTIAEVCQDPWQFSCWNEGDPNSAQLKALGMDDKTFRQCYRVALEAIDGEQMLPLKTRHYYATSMPKPPRWAEEDKLVAVHGRHRFFEGIA